MPQIGGIDVPDYQPTPVVAVERRPTYGQLLSTAAGEAVNQVRYGVPYALQKIGGGLSQADEQFYQQHLGQPSAAAPATVDDLTSGKVGLGRFIGENLISSLPYMAGSLAGGAAGYFAGGSRGAALGAVMGGTPSFVGSNVDRAVQEEGGLSQRSAALSLAMAPIQAASDVVGEAAIARAVPGLGHALGLEAAAKTGGFLIRTAKSVLQAGGVEALTEAGQQVGERFAAGLPLTTHDAVSEYVNAGVTAFAMGGALGLGGGFRRTGAVAKPAAQVTNEDMSAHVDQVLSGQLALPAPPDFYGRADGVAEVNPSGRTQLALPSPEQFRGPDFVADSEGRVAPAAPDGQRDIVVDRNQPQVLQNTYLGNTTPEVQAFLDQAVPQAQPSLLAGTTLGRGLPEISLPPEQVASLAPSVPAVPEVPFDQHLDNLKKGLRGGFVQTVDAADELDLANKVYDQVFVEQDTRSNTAKFAQRVGILDENLQPTPLAAEIERQRTEAAQPAPVEQVAPTEQAAVPPVPMETPVSVVPAPEVTAEELRAAGIQRVSKPKAEPVGTGPQFAPEIEAEMAAARRAADREKAPSKSVLELKTPQDVFTALADDGSTVNITQVEKRAQTLGLITNDDARDVTPKGRQVYLATRDGLEATISAAQEQGYTGAQASMFERGAQTVISGRQSEVALTNAEDWVAHEAGRAWAEDFINNGDGTRILARTPETQKAARERAKGASRRVESAPKSPAEVQRQALNRLVDTADLSNVSDQEVSLLRRRVAEGASPAEVAAAIQKLQGGQSIRTIPQRPVERAPTRGGQPVFREMRRSELLSTAAGVGATNLNTETAVKAYQLRNLIAFAKAEGGITEARAQKLHDLLDQGKADQVERLLKDFNPDAKPRATRAADRAVPVSEHDLELEQAITGKDWTGVVEHAAKNAPSRFYREIAKRVGELSKTLSKAGYQFEVRVVKPGDLVPNGMLQSGNKAYSRVEFNPTPKAIVYLRGSELGSSAVNYQTLLHEMIHATSMELLHYGAMRKATGPIKVAVKDLRDLANAVIDHFNARVKEGNLTPFEQKIYERRNNALQNEHELLAWGLTNPDMQRYLDSIEYKPRQSVFGKLVELVGKLLGIEPRQNSALAELMRVSEQVFKTPLDAVQGMLARNDPNSFHESPIEAALASEEDVSNANRTVSASNTVTQNLSAILGRVTDKFNGDEFGTQARRKVLGWLSHNQIVRQYGHIMPGLVQHLDAHRERVAVRSRFEHLGTTAYQNFEKLEKANPNMAKVLGEAMATATEFQLDPDKAWDAHTHLKGEKNIAALEGLHKQLVEMKGKLRRGDGTGWQVFNEFRALNEAQNYARMASSLHSLVAMDPELTLGVKDSDVNPVDTFMREEGLSNPQAVRDRWSQLLQKQLADTIAFVNAKKGEAAQGTEADQRAMQMHLSPIEMQVSAIHEALAGMQKAPYFHLGRYGDYFGSAVLRRTNGVADPNAQRAVALALEKAGFGDAQISTDNTRPKIALRFNTLDQARQFQVLMKGLLEQGHLDTSEEIKVGPRSRADNFGVADGLPDYVQRYIQAIEASPVYTPDENMDAKERAALEKSKLDAVQLARDTWLEMQPDNSLSKVMAKRYTVPGYDKDMVRNWAHRWRVGSIAIANKAAQPKFNEAFVNMLSQVNQAITSDVVQATKLNDLVTEMKVRDSSVPVNELADTFDKARAIANAYFLGMSPAYGLVNMTQLGVTALPEMAKSYGYAKSFHAMRRASGLAFKVLKAATSEAMALPWQHRADLAITEPVLEKAGLSKAEQSFVLRMMATGTIDIGSAARALGQIAEGGTGSKLDVALRYASAMGLYTETLSRLTTALSARELYGDKPGVERYATKVVSNSMFDYQNWNTARQLGKQGFAGPITPLLTQFMSYNVQLTEKLYSELGDAFGRARPGESAAALAERRAGARRFLAGHLTAVTALAGTLGLPFATVFAAVLERAFGSDDEPFDATAAWRGFLSDTFGQGVGEVIARGLPRALGADLSSRTGEQSLLPFSDLLADKRSWKDAIAGASSRSIGAVPSMLINILDGGSQIASGDLLGGMKMVLPVALRSPTEVFRMTQDGYVDSKGNRLPLTPAASAYLWQLLGFSPAAKAEYQEARGDQQLRTAQLSQRADLLRKQIVQAMITGDQVHAQSLVQDAQQFDKANPAFAVIPSLSSAMTHRLQAQAMARALQSPIGVSMQDTAGQNLTRYANVDYAQ